MDVLAAAAVAEDKKRKAKLRALADAAEEEHTKQHARLNALADASNEAAEQDAYNRYLNRLAKSKEYKAKAEVKKDLAKYARKYYQDLSGNINTRRRARYAAVAALGPKRPRGRPPKSIGNPPEVKHAVLGALGKVSYKDNVGRRIEEEIIEEFGEDKFDQEIIKVTVPPDVMAALSPTIQGVLQDIKFKPNPNTWFYKSDFVGNWLLPNSGKAQGGLTDGVKATYLRDCKKLLNMDFSPLPKEIQDADNPFVIAQWTLKPKSAENPRPFDFWTTVKRLDAISNTKETRNILNVYCKTIVGCWSAQLRAWDGSKQMPDIKDYNTVGWWHIVMGRYLGKFSKHQSFAIHQEQKPNKRVVANFMDWALYEKDALDYINKFYTLSNGAYTLKPKVSFDDARAAAAIACYVLVPPKRNDWAFMEIGDGPLEDQFEQRNILVFNSDGTESNVYWQRFKNSASFKDVLPLKEKIPKALSTLLYSYHAYLKSLGIKRFLFTPTDKKDFRMDSGAFGDLLGSTSEIVTVKHGAKRISSSILRIMYIKWFHKTYDPPLTETYKIMVLLHQTNLATHMAYKKEFEKRGLTEDQIQFELLEKIATYEANQENPEDSERLDAKEYEAKEGDDKKFTLVPGVTTRSKAKDKPVTEIVTAAETPAPVTAKPKKAAKKSVTEAPPPVVTAAPAPPVTEAKPARKIKIRDPWKLTLMREQDADKAKEQAALREQIEQMKKKKQKIPQKIIDRLAFLDKEV